MLRGITGGIAWVLSSLITISGRSLNQSGNVVSRFWHAPVLPDPANFGLNYTSVAFPSRDGLTLRGWWFVSSTDRPVIILLHGFAAHRAEPQERVFGIIRKLHSNGYNVLTFDFRAHGLSEGKHISAGYYEKNDLLGAIDYIRNNGIVSQIGVLGFSMGAAISLMTAAECKEINAVVADSSFSDVLSIIKAKMPRKHFLSFITPAIVSVIRFLYNVDFNKLKPVEAARLISVPVFIIHGGQDKIIPVEHAYRLIKACHNLHNKFWVVPEAKHTYAYFNKPEEYILRISKFFKEAFTDPGVVIGRS
jgi:uncharacterized protein